MESTDVEISELMKRVFWGTLSLGLSACISLSPQEIKVADDLPSIQFDGAPKVIQAHMEAGEDFLKKGFYKEALEEFKAVLKIDQLNEPAQRGAELSRKKFKAERDKVAQSLLQLKETGSDLFRREEYVQAGQAWKEAIQLYQTQKDPAAPRDLTFNPDEIQAQLDRLIQTLLEKGIFLYRQGKLEAAISAWQDVLLIDSQQHFALDYINKARTKLETLEHLSSTSAAIQPSQDKPNPLLQGQTK